MGGPMGFGSGAAWQLGGAVQFATSAQHRWCSYRGVGRICPLLKVLQPATLSLTSPLQDSLREAAGRSPIPLTISQFRTAGSGWAACNIVCPEIWWQRRNTSAPIGNNMMFVADVNQLSAAKLGRPGVAGITLHGRTRSSPALVSVPAARVPAPTMAFRTTSRRQFMLHKPMSHGLAVEVAYTWSS